LCRNAVYRCVSANRPRSLCPDRSRSDFVSSQDGNSGSGVESLLPGGSTPRETDSRNTRLQRSSLSLVGGWQLRWTEYIKADVLLIGDQREEGPLSFQTD